MTDLSFTEAFTSALRGEPTVAHHDGGPRPLPVESWTGAADEADHALLDLCDGDTLDVGCGPGRLTHELARRGHRALGVDVVAEAVRLTRARGGAAVLADVFEPMPHEGLWNSVLLADGNIGIAGDPARLLGRVRELMHPAGRAVVEVAEPGSGSASGWATLEGPRGRSKPFRWARLAMDDVATVSAAAGLVVLSLHHLAPHLAPERSGGRWAAVLEPAP